MLKKHVYSFGSKARTEGSSEMRDLLGGKGANLAEMCGLGLPVPPGFTLTTEVCRHYTDKGGDYPKSLVGEVESAIKALESETKLSFGDASKPLLLSVRSGARASMPGMMDTVLNLGLNDEVVEGLAKSSGDSRFAWDSYRRFIQMYSDVVLGVDHGLFEDALEDRKVALGVENDTELSGDDLKSLTAEFKDIVKTESGEAFPTDPREQLWGAIGAVFASWMNPRAVTYRKLHEISADLGTAVNIQSMVFGNMGEDCGTGVAFTRNPSTGENAFYGEFLLNAQGEDVVSGVRTPQSLTRAEREISGSSMSLEEVMPDIFAELNKVRTLLEKHYRDMQDIEFTIQRGKLYMLQTRSGKRTAEASLRIAVEMAEEGLITKDEAILRVDASMLDQLLHPTLDKSVPGDLLTKGLPASPGAATGEIVLTADKAEELAAAGKQVILVRLETSPEDIHGMHAALGILTARGGMTSHAAVVARGMGRACVCGASALRIDSEEGEIHIGERCLRAGDLITIDGSTGEVFAGEVPSIQPSLSGNFGLLISWADEARRMGVRANAETPLDAETAKDFGAEGIGLCRTEHMFFDVERIVAMREMIMATDTEGREVALAKLLPMQREDFAELFRIMDGMPVTIRLLDPPLHEFLPHKEEDLNEVAKASGVSVKQAHDLALKLNETNPMLGHRGCRLAITYPEICAMQARAIFEAASIVQNEGGKAVEAEIMVPLAATAEEVRLCREIIDKTAEEVESEQKVKITYSVGTMIELPRACLLADEIAIEAAFFSFGTNDLTQTALGISRDDSARFMRDYTEADIYATDPFISIDKEGVGALMAIGVERGRASRSDLKLGICGEHGGDPASIAFCEEIGLDYVSCSPYRVPVARLAAAQSAIRKRQSS